MSGPWDGHTLPRVRPGRTRPRPPRPERRALLCVFPLPARLTRGDSRSNALRSSGRDMPCRARRCPSPNGPPPGQIDIPVPNFHLQKSISSGAGAKIFPPDRQKMPDKLPGFVQIAPMQSWIANYIQAQQAALNSVSPAAIARLVELMRQAHQDGRHIFVLGNGGSAANSSHFATDLGKGASDKLGKRFRVLSLTDNVSWMTALGNDYAYEDVFVGQLQNFGQAGDIVIGVSVSGNSPNCVKALAWAKENGLTTVSLVGAKRGRMAELGDHTIVINETHYGRVEDVQMNILHMLCYAFMEKAAG